MQKKPNDLGLKYDHQKNQKHNEMAEWKKNVTREVEELDKGPKGEIHIDLLKTTLKNIK